MARLAERRADWDRAASALSSLVEGATDGTGVVWALRLAEARDKGGDAAGGAEPLGGL